MDCRSARVALDVLALDAAVQAHIDGCLACLSEQRMAAALRSAVVVEAPPELSTRLLALARPEPHPSRLDHALQQALVIPAPPRLCRRLATLAPGPSAAIPARRPWVMPVYALTALLLGVSLVVAGQVYGLALEQLGVGDLWRGVAQLPAVWLDQFQAFFPQGRQVVALFASLQRALQWVLVGLLMWAVLEMRAPRRVRTTA